MPLAGILLALINIAIVVCGLLLIGLIIVWFIKWLFAQDVDPQMRKLYIAIVGLIALYMLVALAFGLPTWRLIY